MFEAINGMLLDMLAAVARKDYDDRRRRQAQGIAKMKANGGVGKSGKSTGRPEDTERNARIAQALRDGLSWSTIQRAEECSRSTILKVHNRIPSRKLPDEGLDLRRYEQAGRGPRAPEGLCQPGKPREPGSNRTTRRA